MKHMNLEIRITQQWQYISFYIFFSTAAVECKLVCDTKEKYYRAALLVLHSISAQCIQLQDYTVLV